MAHPRVVHHRNAEFDVLIDRTTPWGNPYSHKPDPRALVIVNTRSSAVDSFEEFLLHARDLDAHWMRDHIHELTGKVLGCWCAPLRCHGDVLAKYADHPEWIETGGEPKQEPDPTLF